MSNRLKFPLLILSIVIGISAAYIFVAAQYHAQRQAEAMALIEEMDTIDQKLWQASREFAIALSRFAQNAGTADDSSEGDSGAVRQSHQTLVQSVNQSIAVVSRLKAPESEHGAGFIAAHRKFLLLQRKIIRVDFAKLLPLINDPSIEDSKRNASIQDIVDVAYSETDKAFASVHVAREKFANEFAIHLTAD